MTAPGRPGPAAGRRAALPVAVAAIATVAVVGALDRPTAPVATPAAATRVAVDTTTAVCPSLAGGGPRTTTMTVATAGATGRDAGAVGYLPLEPGRHQAVPLTPRPVSAVTATKPGSAVAVTATGPAAATVVADQHELVAWGRQRSLRSTNCLSPATDWWLTGPEGRVGYQDYLFLANAGADLANITVSAWSEKGPFTPPRLQSYALPAHTTVSLPVAQYAPDAALITFHVHANTGRVVAEAIDNRYAGLVAGGSDWIPPTRPPATRLVVPGFPGGPGYRDLIVTAPGDADATVSLRLSTGSSSFLPAGRQTLHVPAGHSVVTDLQAPFDLAPGAVELSSDVPVVAAAVSQEPVRGKLADVQWQPAGEPLSGPAVLPANAPPFGDVAQLLLTAPAGSAQVRLSSPYAAAKTLTVPAGRTLAVMLPQLLSGKAATGPLVLSRVAGGPVYASRTLFAAGAHGNLITAQQPQPLPAAVVLPPAVEDLRAAVR